MYDKLINRLDRKQVSGLEDSEALGSSWWLGIHDSAKMLLLQCWLNRESEKKKETDVQLPPPKMLPLLPFRGIWEK